METKALYYIIVKDDGIEFLVSDATAEPAKQTQD